MSWSPNLDISDDLKITFDIYETENDYGLSRRSLRPGKTPLDVVECDDKIDDSPDAMAELKLEAYRRKFGVAKKTEKNRWPDEEDDASVELEIYQMIRNSGSVREPRENPLNSKTTSKTATPLDKYPVAGVKGLFLTEDHFKFQNVYFHSPKKDEEPVEENGNRSAGTGNGNCSAETDTVQCGLYLTEDHFKFQNVYFHSPKKDEEPVEENGNCSAGTGNGNCSAETDTVQRKQFIQPKMGVAGEEYVSPAELYAMKSRHNQ